MRLRWTARATLAASLLIALGPCRTATAAPSCTSAASEAQDLRAANKLREARVQLVICSRASCNSVVRSGCEKWLKEVDEQQPTIVVRAVEARGHDVLGARATIDDSQIELDGSAVPVDPGPHTVRLKAKSGDVAERPVLIALGEKARVIELRFNAALAQDGTRATDDAPAASEPAHERRGEKGKDGGAEKSESDPVPIVLLGTGIVGLATFATFEILGQSGYSDLENGCYKTKSCTSDQIDPVRTQFIVAGVALGVSAVALAAAALIHFAGGKPAPAGKKTRGNASRIVPGGFAF